MLRLIGSVVRGVALGLGTSAGRDVYRKVFRGGDSEVDGDATRQGANPDAAGAKGRESAERDAARREAEQLKKRIGELEAQVEALRRQLASRGREAGSGEDDAAEEGVGRSADANDAQDAPPGSDPDAE